jgi:hypothetical protein
MDSISPKNRFEIYRKILLILLILYDIDFYKDRIQSLILLNLLNQPNQPSQLSQPPVF